MRRNPPKVTTQFSLVFLKWHIPVPRHSLSQQNFLGSTNFYRIFNNWSNHTSSGKKKNNNNQFLWGSRNPMGPPTSNPFNPSTGATFTRRTARMAEQRRSSRRFVLTLPQGELWRSPFLVLGVVAGGFLFAPNRLLTFQRVWSFRDH